ncbi:hypothetical protein NPS01_06480 [Nocardioides psychrotolerans]|nr:hypothetical protein NPS01_06480 [Nocardioides psychrotolerans]
MWWAAALALAVWSVASTVIVINSVSYRRVGMPEPLLGRVDTAGRMLSWGLGWTVVVARTSPLRHAGLASTGEQAPTATRDP